MSDNFHEDFTRSIVIRRGSDRSFGFTLTAFLLAAGLWPVLHKQPIRLWPLLASAAILPVVVTRPTLFSPLTRALSALGLLLSRFTNPIVTTALYFVVFVPVGCVARLLGRDLLRLGRGFTVTSYWIPRTPPGPRPDTMSKQF